MKYNEEYGVLMGRRPPDFSRCAASVHSGNWGSNQCSRTATCDPDDNGKPTTCKQHSKAGVKARDQAEAARWIKRNYTSRFRVHGREFHSALQKIAEGHNDPSGLARELLNNFNEKWERSDEN